MAAPSYLLNPEGYHHRPFSEEGCLLFVKLRQYGGERRPQVELRLDLDTWGESGLDGVGEQVLYSEPPAPESVVLQRWQAGAAPGVQSWPDGAEIFLLEGRLEEGGRRHDAGTWIRLPPGDELRARSEIGCLLYLKRNGVSRLEGGS